MKQNKINILELGVPISEAIFAAIFLGFAFLIVSIEPKFTLGYLGAFLSWFILKALDGYFKQKKKGKK